MKMDRANGESMMSASQTVGPFFSIGMEHLDGADMTVPEIAGTVIRIRGKVVDGDGAAVPDAQLEFWQADAEGNYSENKCEAAKHGPAKFTGFARVPTDTAGNFELRTIKPGGVRDSDGKAQAPHIAIFIFMRGLLKPLYTRIYFAGEEANEKDAVLNLVPGARRDSLVAQKDRDGDRDLFRWDVRLQGPHETVFFEW